MNDPIGFARKLLLTAILVTLPILLSAAEFENPALNSELNSIFAEIPGGGMGRLRLINSGEDAWYSHWKLLQSAKASIDATGFMLPNDVCGLSFLGVLNRKAEEGVRIRLMIDARLTRSFFRMLGLDEFKNLVRKPNVKIRFYKGFPNYLGKVFKAEDLKFISGSNHSKIMIIDGKIMITRGQAIGASYFAPPSGENLFYYANDLIIEDRGVTKDLLEAFEAEWNVLDDNVINSDFINLAGHRWKTETARRAMKSYLEGQETLSKAVNPLPKEYQRLFGSFSQDLQSNKAVAGFATFRLWNEKQTFLPIKTISKALTNDIRSHTGYNLSRFINAAKSEIVIQNPCLTLSPEARSLLEKASSRGVQIVLHTNGPRSINVPEASAFFFNEWPDLMRDIATLRIYVSPDSRHQLHSNSIIFDGQVALVSLYKPDPLSIIAKSEKMAVINDLTFASALRRQVFSMTESSVECAIKREANGSVTRVRGPELDVPQGTLHKLELMLKLNWLRSFP